MVLSSRREVLYWTSGKFSTEGAEVLEQLPREAGNSLPLEVCKVRLGNPG